MPQKAQQILRSIITLSFMLFISFGQIAQADDLSLVKIKVIGKNHEILANDSVTLPLPQTAGQVSVQFFKIFSIPFEGDIDGIVSIHHLDSELEILSDTEMKAYGWCYTVNGLVPDDFVHKINITEPQTEIVWFYAYAYYKAGVWIAQCVPHGEEVL